MEPAQLPAGANQDEDVFAGVSVSRQISPVPEQTANAVPALAEDLIARMVGFGKALRGSKKLHRLSYQTKKISMFWSHSWHGSTWRKYMTLLLFYNGATAAVIACLGSAVAAVLFAFELLPVVKGPNNYTEDLPYAHWQTFWAATVGMILYILVLLFWRPVDSIFFDVICIDQLNPERKGKGLLSIGAFLKSSRSMLILWDATYSGRLWTMFEVAAFLRSREEGETPKVVLRPTILGPTYLLLMLTLILVLRVGDSVSVLLSDSGRYVLWSLQFLIYSCGLAANTATFREYFRSVSDSQEQLAGWRLADVKCSCCDTGHVCGGLCEREVVLKCICQWFGNLEHFESRVQTEIMDTFVHEQSRQPFTYSQVVIALVPILWSYLDRASAYARFTEWDPWLQTSCQIARGLAWWLGVGPVAFLTQCRLAYRFQRKCKWARCDPLINLLPLLGIVFVILVATVVEQLCFEPTLFHDGHTDNMLLFAALVLPAAWLLYGYVGAGTGKEARFFSKLQHFAAPEAIALGKTGPTPAPLTYPEEPALQVEEDEEGWCRALLSYSAPLPVPGSRLGGEEQDRVAKKALRTLQAPLEEDFAGVERSIPGVSCHLDCGAFGVDLSISERDFLQGQRREAGKAPTTQDKDEMRVEKKLREICALKRRQVDGETLDKLQAEKIAKRGSLFREVADLKLRRAEKELVKLFKSRKKAFQEAFWDLEFKALYAEDGPGKGESGSFGIFNAEKCEGPVSVSSDGVTAESAAPRWVGAPLHVYVKPGEVSAFAIEVVKGLVRLGWAAPDAAVAELGCSSGSFGFGGTGKKVSAGLFEPYGESFGAGDTIHCEAEREDGVLRIGFAKNAEPLGVAFEVKDTFGDESGLVGAVSSKGGFKVRIVSAESMPLEEAPEPILVDYVSYEPARLAQVIRDFQAGNEENLLLWTGETVYVSANDGEGWLYGYFLDPEDPDDGGWFPADAVEFLDLPPAGLERLEELGVESTSDLANIFSSERDIFDVSADAGVVQAITQAWHLARVMENVRLEQMPAYSHRRSEPTALDCPGVQSGAGLRPKMRCRPPAQLLPKPFRAGYAAPPLRGLAPIPDKRLAALKVILEVVLASGSENTQFGPELRANAAEAFELFAARFRNVVDARLQSHVGAFKRWVKWHSAHVPSDIVYWKPSAFWVARYLADISKGGPTASCHAFASLKWWSSVVGLPLPMADGLVLAWASPTAEHVVQPRTPLSLGIFWAMLRAWKSASGKRRVQGRRPPFDWAIPARITQTVDLSSQLFLDWTELQEQLGKPPTFIVQDLDIARGSGLSFIEWGFELFKCVGRGKKHLVQSQQGVGLDDADEVLQAMPVELRSLVLRLLLEIESEAMAKSNEFRRCLEDQKLPEPLIAWCESTLGIETLSDFCNIVTVNGYESELDVVILSACEDTKAAPNKALLLARLRAAWRAARASILKVEARQKTGQPVDDLDDPLDPATQESLLDAWRKRYNLELPVHMAPSDTLLGRVWREMQRGTVTVIGIDKVRSLFAANRPQKDRFLDLGSAKLQLRPDEEARAAQSVAEYYQRLRVLCNAYTIAGTFKVDSKQTPGTKVFMAPLGVLLDYCDAVLRHATDSNATIEWLKIRDEQCRARMVELARQQWPLGEAFFKAYQEQELMWQQPPSRKRVDHELHAASDSPPSSKKAKTAKEHRGEAAATHGGSSRLVSLGGYATLDEGETEQQMTRVVRQTGHRMSQRTGSGDDGSVAGGMSFMAAPQPRLAAIAKSLAKARHVQLVAADNGATTMGMHNQSAARDVKPMECAWPCPYQVEALIPTEWVYYCGVSPLPQTHWSLHDKGPIFVISLFDGIGAAFVALLALGVTFRAVAVEMDPVAAGVCAASFRNVAHFTECRDLLASLNTHIPVLQLLENVAHGPTEDIAGALSDDDLMHLRLPDVAASDEERATLMGIPSSILQWAAPEEEAEYTRELLDHTVKEIEKGWADGLFTRQELDEAFGPSCWLPMQRFMHVQACGKQRPIDNGRSNGHNALSWMLETICTNTPDFAAAACRALMDLLHKSFDVCPAWAQVVFGTEDMDHAYRQMPNMPEEAPGLVVGIWHPAEQIVKYAVMRAHPFGLASAVLNFCRLPTLATAATRQWTGMNETATMFIDVKPGLRETLMEAFQERETQITPLEALAVLQANVSDGLSRSGTADDWTRQQAEREPLEAQEEAAGEEETAWDDWAPAAVPDIPNWAGETPEWPEESEAQPSDEPVEEEEAVPGLAEWLQSIHLHHYGPKAADWCAEMGAVSTEEIKECWEEFAQDLGLKPLEKKRLEKACR
ncbi:ddx1 [Symbiodinium sp. KB8]|nr:ddx1 [Symbiodinium sp. KB8]